MDKNAEALKEAVRLYGASYGTVELLPDLDLYQPTDWPKSFKGRKLLDNVDIEPDNSDPFLLTSYILNKCKRSTFNDVGLILDSAPVCIMVYKSFERLY
jgi:hypothetical protein